jgi:shikimate kinase
MWLIGMMGSGKSTVGALAAQALGVDFYDTDRIVCERTGLSIPEIWERLGERAFRDLECEAVTSVPAGSLAAAGGGAVLEAANREIMASSPPVIWLRTSPETTAARIGDAGGRPLLDSSGDSADSLTEILSERASLYQRLATHVVDTDELTAEQVSDEVVSICRS